MAGSTNYPTSLDSHTGGNPYGGGGGSGGQTVVVNVTVQGSMIHERELEAVVGQAVSNQLRYGGQLGGRG